jgi:hypothetical protein
MPRVSTVPKHVTRLQFVVTAEKERAIYRAAERARKSVSALVRDVMDEYLLAEPPEQKLTQREHEQERVEA